MDHGRVARKTFAIKLEERNEWEDKDWDGCNAEKDLWEMKVKKGLHSQGVVSK